MRVDFEDEEVRELMRKFAKRREVLPPYGPTQGMMEALELLRRTTPARVDGDFLRANGIAPGNEYKVIGALRFLGLIDEEGRPTPQSRLLKTKGETFSKFLKELVYNAYSGLFKWLKGREITPEEVYNYFVTEEALGAEMANKAARFFLKLCEIAGIEMASPGQRGRRGKRERRKEQPLKPREEESSQIEDLPESPSPYQPIESAFPFVHAITPETARLSVEELSELFRKMKLAWIMAGK